jgi:aspartyl aminopeptidase
MGARLALLATLVLARVAAASPPEHELARDYKRALDQGQTSLTFVRKSVERAVARGFRRVDVLGDPRGVERFAPGDRLVFVNRGRTVLLVVVGKHSPADGVRIVGTHVDTPHLRVLQKPFGRSGTALTLRASSRGGLKGYQWESLPLRLVGVVHKRGGRAVEIDLGEREGMTFAVSALKAAEPADATTRWPRPQAFPRGPRLFEVLAASVPSLAKGAKDPVKYSLLEVLKDRYGIEEADLASTELELVPAGRARDVGLDRALIGAFGQDDRLCSFAALRAAIDLSEIPPRTAIAYLTDREEVGSGGVTGARSAYLLLALQHLLRGSGVRHDRAALRHALAKTEVLSGDVAAGVNPIFPEVHELGNAPRLGAGPALKRYTGYAGKQQGSEANAEFTSRVVRILDAAGVPWQSATMGRVDEGGGGTIGKFLAETGAQVLDVGAPVVSMHSPMELSSKRDLHALYRAFSAFFRAP